MTATDGDKDRPQNIVYFLTGQGIDPDNPANSKFDINRTTGEIFVLKVNYYFLLLVFLVSPLALLMLMLLVPQQIELNENNFHDFIFRGRTCWITLIYANILKQIESEGKILFSCFPEKKEFECRRWNKNMNWNLEKFSLSLFKNGTIME